ncbi:MAG: hypothetical protein ACKVWR_07950, partial [Acidimicrobiales bacterium]
MNRLAAGERAARLLVERVLTEPSAFPGKVADVRVHGAIEAALLALVAVGSLEAAVADELTAELAACLALRNEPAAYALPGESGWRGIANALAYPARAEPPASPAPPAPAAGAW